MDIYQPLTSSVADIKRFLSCFGLERLVVGFSKTTQEYLSLDGIVHTPLIDGLAVSILTEPSRQRLVVGQYVCTLQ